MNQLIPFPPLLYGMFGLIGLLMALFLMRWRDRSRMRRMMWVALRGIAGALLVATALTVMLRKQDAMTVALFLLVMMSVPLAGLLRFAAVRTRKMISWLAVSFIAGFLPALAFMYFIILKGFPIQALQFAIPLAGLLLTLTLTALQRGVAALLQGLSEQYAQMEALMMLGATRKQVSKALLDETCEAALRGVFESLGGMGAVTLPGMFAGMVMAGVLPSTAMAYQLAILMAGCMAIAISCYLLVTFLFHGMFNQHGLDDIFRQ